jgi:hypothetical protein
MPLNLTPHGLKHWPLLSSRNNTLTLRVKGNDQICVKDFTLTTMSVCFNASDNGGYMKHYSYIISSKSISLWLSQNLSSSNNPHYYVTTTKVNLEGECVPN